MMYKCDCCGLVMEKEDVKIVSECIGEAWGVPQYQDEAICPRCKGPVNEYIEEEDEEEKEEMSLQELIDSLITLRDEGECVSQTMVLDEAIRRLREEED